MSVLVSQIYSQVCFDLCEDFGLQLGIVTVQQFYDILNLVTLDFLKRSGLLQRVWTQSIFSGQTAYAIPDDIIDVQSVWLAGRWLPGSTQSELNGMIRSWRMTPAVPRFYYTDGLGLQSLGLAPYPNYNSSEIIGVNYPNPSYGIYDQFWANCMVNGVATNLNPAQHRGLTVIGTQKAITQVANLNDPIPLIPDQFAIPALTFGVLERIFGGDNELHDAQRSAYAKAQFEEQINVCRMISGTPSSEDAE